MRTVHFYRNCAPPKRIRRRVHVGADDGWVKVDAQREWACRGAPLSGAVELQNEESRDRRIIKKRLSRGTRWINKNMALKV